MRFFQIPRRNKSNKYPVMSTYFFNKRKAKYEDGTISDFGFDTRMEIEQANMKQ